MSTSFSLLSSIWKNTAPVLIIELRDKQDLLAYSAIFSSHTLPDCVEKNFSQEIDKKEKVFPSYQEIFQSKKVFYFFPWADTLLEDRSEFIAGMKESFTYVSNDTNIASLLDVLMLASYTYDTFVTKKRSIHISYWTPQPTSPIDVELRQKCLNAVCRARDLVNLPPSLSTPKDMVQSILSFPWKRTKVTVLDKKELTALGMNLLLAVSAGSDNDPYVVIFERIIDNTLETYSLIGKWVTFDAGGIQIKPGDAMFDMKMDMAGAAGIVGVMEFLDSIDSLECNIIWAVGFTENMTGWSAYKPLDIYKAYNGTTVEIHHTDAEGRLLLADVMSYVEKNYNPGHIITMATLTGACIYALWYDYAWVIWDDEAVISQLELLSKDSLEKIWRLPLNDKMIKSLKAEIADIKNIAKTEKAGSSIGAAFLTYFQWNAKLTHLDIAGPAYRNDRLGYMLKWATGWGVMILSDLIRSIRK